MEFYVINENYIKYLKKYESDARGFTNVPDVKYGEKEKFAFGVVLEVNGIPYYVMVSSFDKKQEANILIRIPGDKKEVKGSLRFNYMIPVPNECIVPLIIKNIKDEKYRNLVNKEYQFCIGNKEKIRKKAQKIYELVVEQRKGKLVENSCDFKLLEEAYSKYLLRKNDFLKE